MISRYLVTLTLLLLFCGLVQADMPRYRRMDWGLGWMDADHDCQNTRQEVLIRDSRIPVTLDPKGCRVVYGNWLDPYTGEAHTNPRDMDIDHVVPLQNAFTSGAWRWTNEQRHQYSNDLTNPDTLLAVSFHANRQKGDRGPDAWLPREEYRCQYVHKWRVVKELYHLDMTATELSTIQRLEVSCSTH